MPRTLKLFNGRPFGHVARMHGRQAHVYVAAYSNLDARRVCVEAGLGDPKNTEVSKYWSHNAWGKPMDGITPERGIWITTDRFKAIPKRLPLYRDSKL